MRRADRERDRVFAQRVIDTCDHAVVAMTGESGAPYCVPVSPVRIGPTLYFHCALAGKKVSILRRDPRVWITFVARNVAAAGKLTTYYESAMAGGTAVEVTDAVEKRMALEALCRRYTPDALPSLQTELDTYLARTGVWKVELEELTGKANGPQ